METKNICHKPAFLRVSRYTSFVISGQIFLAKDYIKSILKVLNIPFNTSLLVK